jgi:lactate permease
MKFFLALVPILLILYLMVGRRWGASRAGGAGYLCALVLAVAYFGAGPELLAFAHTKALLLAFDVLFIVWTAFLHFRVADEAGAIATLGEVLKNLTQERGMLALILGFAFASFLQGIGGFGVPVAIVAPMMVGVGFAPLQAVVIPSIGHAWAVTFGSLGSSFQALMGATAIDGAELDFSAAIMLGAAGVATGLAITHAAGGWRGLARWWGSGLLLGAGMATVQLVLAVNGLWNMAAAGAGVFGVGASIWLAGRLNRGRTRSGEISAGRVWLALSAYVILVAVMLLVQLVPPVNAFLGQAALVVEFPETRSAAGFVTPPGSGREIHWFSHAGAILFYASALGYLVYRSAGLYDPGAAGRILRSTLHGVLSSSISIAAMVAMAVLMGHAGMTDALARGLAESFGRWFPLVSPWIGALGAFMTGSNTNSNVVLAALQLRTAQLLGLAVPWVLAAQTTGGAIGSVIAPTKIVVGAATAGIEGREGEVIGRLAGYVLALMIFVTLLTVVILR